MTQPVPVQWVDSVTEKLMKQISWMMPEKETVWGKQKLQQFVHDAVMTGLFLEFSTPQELTGYVALTLMNGNDFGADNSAEWAHAILDREDLSSSRKLEMLQSVLAKTASSSRTK